MTKADLVRMGEPLELRQDERSSVGTLSGYFAVFNQPTLIDNPDEGRFVERIAPGAFARTLSHQGLNVTTLFNHGMDPQIGSKPLGVPSVLREDDRGVYAEVPLDDTSYNRDIAASLKSGALRGQSFRFRSLAAHEAPADNEWDLPEVIRTELALKEFGPVTFPAYAGTSAALRSLVMDLDGPPTEPVENILRLAEHLRAADLTLSKPQMRLIAKAMQALTAMVDAATPPEEEPAEAPRSFDPAELETSLRNLDARLRAVR